MPFKSKSQQRYFHTDSAKKAGITEGMVKEYDKASKGKKLPEKATLPKLRKLLKG